MASFNEIISSSIPTLVDFTASWCGPCRALAPVLDDVKNSLGDKVRIIKIDVDKNPKVSDQFKIRSVPTLILFKAGEIQWRQSGGMDKHTLISRIQPSFD